LEDIYQMFIFSDLPFIATSICSGRMASSLRRRYFGHCQTGLRLCLAAMPSAAS